MTKQSGGLLRLGTIYDTTSRLLAQESTEILDRYRQEMPETTGEPQPLWLVDCGNFVSGGRLYPELRAKTHLDVLALVGGVAAVPGYSELALTKELALDCLADTALPLTSCNLLVKEPEVTVERYLELAPGWFLIGLSSWRPAPIPLPEDTWWELAEPLQSVKDVLAGLPPGSQAVLVAEYQPAEIIRELAKLPLTAIIGYEAGPDEAWPDTSAPVFPPAPLRGTELQLLKIQTAGETPAISPWEIDVSDDWPDSEEVDLLVRGEQKQVNARLKEEREKLWGAGGWENVNWGTSEKYLPSKDQDGITPPEGAAYYVGAESCGSCHEDAYAAWKETAHSHALASLARSAEEDNMDCLICHVTGLLEPRGFDPFYPKELMSSVSCERCHGPGSEHLAKTQEGEYTEDLSIERGDLDGCKTCHDDFNSPQFDAAEGWEKIAH